MLHPLLQLHQILSHLPHFFIWWCRPFCNAFWELKDWKWKNNHQRERSSGCHWWIHWHGRGARKRHTSLAHHSLVNWFSDVVQDERNVVRRTFPIPNETFHMHQYQSRSSWLCGSSSFDNPKREGHHISRPVDPQKQGYKGRQREKEKGLARTVQVHQCGMGCMKVTNKKLACKRRAPFKLADSDWVNEDGQCGPKRMYGYLNNWCPSILQCIRANHNIKLISNGTETKDITWYITIYVGKKWKFSSNMSALLANTFVFHQWDENNSQDLKVLNKKLIQCCANTLSRQQELSAPEVISYLMGWGDHYESHHFVTIHWHFVVCLMKWAYPELTRERWDYILFSSMIKQTYHCFLGTREIAEPRSCKMKMTMKKKTWKRCVTEVKVTQWC